MRIYGTNGVGAVVTAPSSRRAASDTFNVDDGDKTQRTSSATGLRTVGGIDALIALQGCEDPLERRKRAVKRGRIALEALDRVKIALLSGDLDRAALNRLKAAAAELDERSGDAGLDAVLAEIEVRVEVELAKLDPTKKAV